jgi:hypothetical protein
MSELHSAERLERDLRAWLASEAGLVEVPAGFAERMAAVEPVARAPRRGLAWSWPPRGATLVGVAALLVVALVAGLLLAGLPFGPDCSRVRVEAVRGAADEVPGYRYTASATELMNRIGFGGDQTPEYTYSTATIEAAGAYEAPDAWSLDILRLDNPDSPVPPHGALWILSEEWEAFLYADGAGYARAAGAARYTRLQPGDLFVEQMGPNRVADLLLGRPFRLGLPGQEANPLTWTVATANGFCRLAAANPTVTEEQGGEWELAFDIDPDTLLPSTATYRLATPEIAPTADSGGAPATDVRWQFTFDYAESTTIEPPTDPEVPPVDEARAMDDAAEAGIGAVGERTGLGRGSTELWLVRGTDGVAILRYEAGILVATEVVDVVDDVAVEVVEGEEGRFLVVVANDARVSHVRVELTESDSLLVPEVPESLGRPLVIVDAEGLGDIVTWFAYDESDRELVVNPPPPG